MKEEIQKLLRQIPAMDIMMNQPWVQSIEETLGRKTVKALFSDVMGEIRNGIKNGSIRALNTDHIILEAYKRIKVRSRVSLRPLINATGVIIHTNLGRSCLAPEAADAVYKIACSYCNLEYSLETGSRGQRNTHVEWLICQLTGAEAALVVNNNAGAVVLALAALAKDREVIISRGELVEIGGSFRIPEIMEFSGAVMKEVGTTNQTHLPDYVNAINEETSMLLKVHPSNFSIQGFHGSVSRCELAGLAHQNELIFMEDLGSGMLFKLGINSIDTEATVRESLDAGADLVTFSGDKMLGGPQIGCIAGSAKIIEKLRKNPFLRALRVDKMTLAAFETTLRLYLRDGIQSIPTLSMVRCPLDKIKLRAQLLARRMRAFFKEIKLENYSLQVLPVEDAVGGGAYPQIALNGFGVWLEIKGRDSVTAMVEKLRLAEYPVITGIQDNKIVFHARTLQNDDIGHIIKTLHSIFIKEDGGV